MPNKNSLINVLIIEDNPIERALYDSAVGEMAKKEGFGYLIVDCGEKAVELIKAYHNNPDDNIKFGILVADISLRGGIDGIATVRECLSYDRNLRVIFVSSFGDYENNFRYPRTELGSDDFIFYPKGVNIKIILQGIRESIEVQKNFESVYQQLTDSEDRFCNSDAIDRKVDLTLAKTIRELLTPLTAIIGGADLLSDNTDTMPDPETLRSLKMACQQLHRYVKNHLTCTAIKLGEINISSTSFSISKLVDDCRIFCLNTAKNKQVKVECIVDKKIPDKLFGDPMLISQIINNLLMNAIEYSNRKNKVCLRVRLEVITDGIAYVEFEVEDSGKGLSARDQKNVFTRFHRTNLADGNIGLGLYSSYKLAHHLGGELTVASTIGKGSKFTLTVPLGET